MGLAMSSNLTNVLLSLIFLVIAHLQLLFAAPAKMVPTTIENNNCVCEAITYIAATHHRHETSFACATIPLIDAAGFTFLRTCELTSEGNTAKLACKCMNDDIAAGFGWGWMVNKLKKRDMSNIETDLSLSERDVDELEKRGRCGGCDGCGGCGGCGGGCGRCGGCDGCKKKRDLESSEDDSEDAADDDENIEVDIEKRGRCGRCGKCDGCDRCDGCKGCKNKRDLETITEEMASVDEVNVEKRG